MQLHFLVILLIHFGIQGLLESAAIGGHRPTIDWLISYFPYTWHYNRQSFFRAGNTYLIAKAFLESKILLENAVQSRKIEIVDEALKSGASIVPEIFSSVALLGSLEMFIHLEQKYPKFPSRIPTDEVVRLAVSSGNVNLVKYLWEKFRPSNVHQIRIPLCVLAANGNHLSVLQYLQTVDCLWSEESIIAAAKTASFECLKYCLENGCQVLKDTTARAISLAAHYGHINASRDPLLAYKAFRIVTYLHTKYSAPIPADALSTAIQLRAYNHFKDYISEAAKECQIFSKDVSDMILTLKFEIDDMQVLSVLENLISQLKAAEQDRLKKYK